MRALLCFLALTLPARAADDDKDYYPLKVGMKWTYKLGEQDNRFVVTVAAEEKVGEVVCVKLEAKLKDQIVGTEHVAFQKDGFYRFKYGDMTIEPPICFCKPGAKKGESWKLDFKIGETKATVRYEADFQDVKVPAGEFKNALVIKAEAIEKIRDDGKEKDQITRTTIWFVKGKGMVKQTIDLGEAKVNLELESIEEPKK